jgi:hypothetical protein
VKLRAAVTLLILAGCGRSDDAETPAAAPAAVPPIVQIQADSSRAGRGDCPATGLWALCSLETRLRRSGFVAARIDGDTSARAGFRVKPVAYKLGRGRLEVFLYENAAALEKDVTGIDTVAVAPVGSPGTWPSPPAFVRSGNLAAVFMDQNARQAERLVLAITAGAPSAR